MIRFMVLAIGSGLPAYGAWTVCQPYGVLPGFLAANVAFALGWFVSRRFVADFLDL
jgi:hypothetical protein